jgi:acyl-CoA oxidase
LQIALRDLADDYAALQRSRDPDPHERMHLEARAAGLKAMATTHATATIQECREACGGAGYMWENRFGALKADSDILTTFEGDNTVLLQLVAKMLLTDFKQQFEDMDLAAMARFLVGRVVSAVIPTPASRRTDMAHLRDRAFHLEAFRAREQVQLTHLARRLKRALDEGSDPYAAFIRQQTRAVELARSHAERIVLERFTAAIENCSDRSLAIPLSRCATSTRSRTWNGTAPGTSKRACSPRASPARSPDRWTACAPSCGPTRSTSSCWPTSADPRSGWAPSTAAGSTCRTASA